MRTNINTPTTIIINDVIAINTNYYFIDFDASSACDLCSSAESVTTLQHVSGEIPGREIPRTCQ